MDRLENFVYTFEYPSSNNILKLEMFKGESFDESDCESKRVIEKVKNPNFLDQNQVNETMRTEKSAEKPKKTKQTKEKATKPVKPPPCKEKIKESRRVEASLSTSDFVYDDPFLDCQNKRMRNMFSLNQIDILEKIFDQTHYPDSGLREQLSKSLNLDISRIQVWFQNRRAKFRKLDSAPKKSKKEQKQDKPHQDQHQHSLSKSIVKLKKSHKLSDKKSSKQETSANDPLRELIMPVIEQTQLLNAAAAYIEYPDGYLENYCQYQQQQQQQHLQNQQQQSILEYQNYLLNSNEHFNRHLNVHGNYNNNNNENQFNESPNSMIVPRKLKSDLINENYHSHHPPNYFHHHHHQQTQHLLNQYYFNT